MKNLSSLPLGKKLRLQRILGQSGKTIIVPMDHGVTEGPIAGLIDMGKTLEAVVKGGANAIVGHMGLPLHFSHALQGTPLLLHLSGSTTVNPVDVNDKVLVNSVARAVKMGADGISVQLNIGVETESAQLEILGRIADECLEWGMPLLVMAYYKGHDHSSTSVDMIALVARVASELGADLVKVSYTGDVDSMRKVVEGCLAPVIIAGGGKADERSVLEMVKGAMDSGCAGLSMGRNVFQHARPDLLIKACGTIVHEGTGVEEAMKILSKSH